MLEIEFAYMTHPGKIRKRNQDNLICVQDYLPLEHDKTDEPVRGIAILDSPLLFGVFDGMGGEDHGEAASYLAAKTAALRKPTNENDLDPLCREMNKNICTYVSKHHIRSSGTTASLLLFDQRGVTTCHIGDSRIYRCREGVMKQLTKDDVWPFFRGRKAPLLQCLGIPENEMHIKPHIDHYSTELNDIYVICTDGLSDTMEQNQIVEILSSDINLRYITQMLMDRALEIDGKDNITILLNRVINSA